MFTCHNSFVFALVSSALVVCAGRSAFGEEPAGSSPEDMQADLLIVGGTESGWAAAIQAARMGVERIVLVNDVDWLGGQFTAEAMVAIDENRSLQEAQRTDVGRRPSIPRSGLFKELTDIIEAFDAEEFGNPNPGNTIVGTTCRPADAAEIFQGMIVPYVGRGQIQIIPYSYYPVAAQLAEDGKTLRSVRFRRIGVDQNEPQHDGDFSVTARITIDASDWGEVIQLSGAEFEYGPDLRSKYGEPLAPTKRDDYPLTDMNPISYCLVIEETDGEQVVPRPEHYDERRYFNTTRLTRSEEDALPWPHKPVEAFATVDDVYGARRIVDHYGVAGVAGPDAILLCWFVQDYPLDVLPRHVVEELENIAPGASRKNIVTMTRRERQVVFDDAKQHSLGMLHHLQTTVHDRMKDRAHSFRRFQLSNEFRTPDHLPPKPYLRESLRLKAMYMMRQQDTSPVVPDGDTYARVMYHDGITPWQFEYDFHMTGRTFLPDDATGEAWQSYFKPGREWGPPYSGRCLIPLRSLIPQRVDGLLGAEELGILEHCEFGRPAA